MADPLSKKGSFKSLTIEGKIRLMKKPYVCIVTTTLYAENLKQFLDNAITLMRPISNLHVITGNFPNRYDNVEVIEVERNCGRLKNESLSFRLLQNVKAQLKITFEFINNSSKFQIVCFHSGEYLNLLPCIMAKLLRKKIIIFHLGGNKLLEARKAVHSTFERTLVAFGWTLFMRTCYSIADIVACESPSIVQFAGLNRFTKKIAPNIGRFVDTYFSMRIPISKRGKKVGYIGRIVEEKGIVPFSDAVPLILARDNSIGFQIIGDGTLLLEIEKRICSGPTKNSVIFEGWIAQKSLPEHLNSLSVLVVPSYTEGVPGIIQEAMACGTIVLATPVGGIPDLVRDHQTGFLLRDNTPEEIANSVISIFNSHSLSEISKNAMNLIEKEYTFQSVLNRYKSMLDKLIEAQPYH